MPWPAITSSSSNGCTSVRPSDSASATAAATESSTESPDRRTAAPYPSVAPTFASDAASGMYTIAGTPAERAANATAWAWFPADGATTPAARSASVSERILL